MGSLASASQVVKEIVYAYYKYLQYWVSGISLYPFRSKLETTPKVMHFVTPHPALAGLREYLGGSDD